MQLRLWEDQRMPFDSRGDRRPVANPSNSPFLSQMRATFGTEMVRVLRNLGTEDEESFETEALIQGKLGSFDINTPVFEGDYVELPDPRRGEGGVELRYVAKATVLRAGPEDMHRVKVEWGTTPPPPRVAPVRRLSLENLHPGVQDAAGELFMDGHYQPSVAEAFKSLEVRVRSMTGSSKSGAPLMGDAFAFQKDDPPIDVAIHEGQSGKDEREGFHAIFRGVMLGIRNPRAHELFAAEDPQQALEYLGLASLLHRRLDAAELKDQRS
ncbi:TIGR02391 family protein [Terrabacter sp. RAF57]|uniref:TIGR02391 family protein n=1 Tax=Terrabacter sp. RAF57 TaxID=3233063 RepID=UPI003F9B0E19